MTRLFTLIAALAAASFIALAGPIGADAKSPPPPAGFFGVHPRETSASDYAKMRDEGITSTRTGWVFSSVKPNAAAPWNWAAFDPQVIAASREGVRILPVLIGAPGWLGVDPPLIGDSDLYWRFYLAGMGARYGPGGSFWDLHPELPYRPIRDWQVWNEPNALSNWADRPDGSEYADFLVRSAQMIHSVDPRATVVGAGVISVPQNPKATDGLPYLSEMLSNPQARAALGAVAVHPYARSVQTVESQLKKTRALLNRVGMRSTPIWVTEIGWGVGRSTSKYDKKTIPLAPNTKSQRKMLKKAFSMISRERRALKIGRVYWYQWKDGENGSCGWCQTSGLLRENGRPKPLLGAFQKYARNQ